MQFDRSVHYHISQERIQYGNVISFHGFLGGIDRSDLPFVYHHLRKGCLLSVHSIAGGDNRHFMYGVNYGSYRLGILNSQMAKRIDQLQSNGNMYRLTIAEVVKEKYMPPTAIIIQLEYETSLAARVA